MIELKNISKSFDDKKVLDSFSAVFDEGGYLLKGPSGIGKTTCILLILRLIKPDEGELVIPDNMRFAVCFQENRLFENETALTNILAVNDNVTEEAAKAAIRELLPEDTAGKKAGELSGGMKRRVALARALAFKADALLLDEPFKGLDQDLMESCAHIIRETGKPAVVSTHSEAEAKALGAEIIHLK